MVSIRASLLSLLLLSHVRLCFVPFFVRSTFYLSLLLLVQLQHHDFSHYRSSSNVSSSVCMFRAAIIRKYVDQNGGIEEGVGSQDDDRGMNRFILDRQTTTDKRRTTNDKRQTTNDKRRTTNDERRNSDGSRTNRSAPDCLTAVTVTTD